MNPIAPDGPWSLGTLIGFPVGVLITLVALAALAFGLRVLRDDDIDPFEMGFWLGTSALVAVAAGGLTAWGMYPYDSEFHQWRPVAGEVERIDKRLVGSGDGMSERYVVTIQGRPFAVDDSRAATLEVGDDVALSCKREWQYAANSGWGCRWAGDKS